MKSDSAKPDEMMKVSEVPSKSQGSLLDQVMACTLGNVDGGDFSDDDTFGTDTIGENTTYDSYTDADDGYEPPSRRRGRSRRQ